MIKKGIKISGLKTEALLAFIIADRVYKEHGIKCVITEITGGKHGIGSLHYSGLAFDLRIKNIPTKETTLAIVKQLKDELGENYDAILESDHIHIEFQPK